MAPTRPRSNLRELVERIRIDEGRLREGGGSAAIERQHQKGRWTARERITRLVDPRTTPLELGLWAGYGMYDEWGGAPGAGVVTCVGRVAGRRQMIVANDATVKAGAFFPATAKKVLRAQRIAFANRLPLIYLVDSAGIFLPLQEDVFPDEDDFGRIFRNNAVISAAGIPQIAAIMGNCVAGGGYLPVLCDKVLMTEGSGLYLAGPALVKSAIGQQVSSEELGGATMHATISGTVDFHEPNDEACIDRIRRLVELGPPDAADPPPPFSRIAEGPPRRDPEELDTLVSTDPRRDYEIREVLDCILDAGTWNEFRPDYGRTIVCGTARLGGYAIGVVANQHHRVTTPDRYYEFGGVIYVESAEKAARFVLNCNQETLPILFLQDVNGFMVGKDSEREGIIKAGAKLVNAVSNSRSPKLTVLMGGSYGAGNYALCGKAFDPRFLFAWPTARCAVMGADQAVGTLVEITAKNVGPDERSDLDALRARVGEAYERQTDVRYAAARGWVDAILEPSATRTALIESLAIVTRAPNSEPFRVGVYQV
ncbi:MAG: acyl-CoA carboxylase subunit beta [Planctomycetes bacterium]|nr:acyl-CoA carboxylase subunit beta [Planctomycetota bacterium]